MFRHGGLNRVYRLVWSESTGAFIPIAEKSLKAPGQRSSGVVGSVSSLALIVAAGLAPLAWADPNASIGMAPRTVVQAAPPAPNDLPTQGNVIAGQAHISQTANHQTIHQSTDKVAIDWQSFNIGSESKVTFVQPGLESIALNRVVTHEASHIYGALEANGQVFLINPNGVLFGKGAQVDVGGIVASTRDIDTANFMAGNFKFSGDEANQILNEGIITARQNGYVVLVGAQVVNRGEIHAQEGDVRLAAATEVELQLDKGGLLNLSTTQGALDALAANGGLIKADGGRIFLTADALDHLSKAVVNNTGIIEAHTVVNKNGKIVLLGDMDVGTTEVAGTLDASAPDGGDGGFIETSASKVIIDSTASIDSSGDQTGTWLIDPVDFTVAASGGDMTGTTLSANLVNNNVTIQSTSGSTGVNGDVNVNDAVSWTTANSLTLNAQGNININASISTTAGSLALEYGQSTGDGAGFNYYLADGVKVDLPDGQNFSTRQGSAGSTDVYTVISSLGLEGSDDDDTLQGIKGNLDGFYVMGADIDANATANWNVINGVPWGFDAIGSGFQDPQTLEWQNFTGNFDGLGHTIDGLYINRDVRSNQGLFGVVHGVTIQNVSLTDVNITGNDNMGSLVGNAANIAGPSTFRNIHVSGTVNGNSRVGGLIGRLEEGSIDRASTSATVNAGLWVGGVGGELTNVTLSNLNASGQVSGEGVVGGAVGRVVIGSVTNITTSGTVNASDSYAGGAFGMGDGTFENIHSTANVTGGGGYAGGLFGEVTGTTMNNVSATGTVSGVFSVGGLIGRANLTITDASATGAVTGTGNEVGGLIGESGGDLTNGEASGAVSGRDSVGGLIGANYGDITDSQATGNVIGSGESVGGLVGLTQETVITNSHAYGTVTGANKLGGLAGANKMGQIINSTANGLTAGTGDQVGGLVGYNKMGLVDNSGYTAASVSGSEYVGGLVGFNEGGTVQNSNVATLVTGENYSGGLVGGGDGTITNAYATGNVSGASYVGGLAGGFAGVVSDAYATGSVSASGIRAGGLIGSATANITNTYATGAVTGVAEVGGLNGWNGGSLSDSTASGAVSGETNVGGAVGRNSGNVTTVEASGAVTGTVEYAGGAVGNNEEDSVVIDTSASGNVMGVNAVGGLVGRNQFLVQNGSATGTVSATGSEVGGIIGRNAGTLNGGNYTGASVTTTTVRAGGAVGSNLGSVSGATVATVVSGVDDIGGIVGYNDGQLSTSTATGTVAGTGNAIGGAVGYMDGGNITGVTTSANVSGVNAVGGFVGDSGGTITNSHATGTVSGNWGVGGFVGENYATITASTASGAVTGVDQSIGGFTGHHHEGAISNSQASGDVNGGSYAGGFVGYLDGAEIYGSTANGNVSGVSRVGGFVGYSDGLIVESTANGDTAGLRRVGGFVGRATSDSEIIDSVANGDVIGTEEEIGGFAGTNAGYLAGAQALGAVNGSGAEGVGGLVGMHEGWIEGGSASGAVTGGADVGGLVGRVMSNDGDDPTTVVDASAAGTVAGVTNVGGYIGFNDGVEIAGGTATAAVTGTERVGGFVGLNTGALYDSSSTSLVSGVNMVGGYAGENRGLLQYVWAEVGNVTATGDMTGGLVGLLDSAGVIEYASAYGAVNGTTNTGGFVGYVMAGGAINFADSENNAVTGTTQVGGFFGYNAGALSNINTEAPVTGQEDVGGFGGHNAVTGTLNAVYSEGNVIVTGTAPTISAGGLVGENVGAISVAYALGNVTGSAAGADVGGLVGTQSGAVSDAYATGAVSGAANVGSVLGHMNAGTANNIYGRGATSQVGISVGGLVGLMAGGILSNGYWNTATTGSAGAFGSMTGGTMNLDGGLTAEQALLASSYIGFDFTAGTGVWKNYETDTTPLLTHWLEELTITVNDAPITHVYNGQGRADVVTDLTYSDQEALESDDIFGAARYNTGKNVGVYTDLVGLYSHQQGYNITLVNNGSLEITPKAIDVAATGIDRAYDGTMNIGVTLGSAGLIEGDNVDFSGSASLADRNAGSGKSVNVINIAADGLDVGNYTFNNTTAQTTANVTPKLLQLAAVGTDKIYDGTTTIGVGISATSGVVDGDNISFTGAGNTADKNAGVNKSVSVTDIAVQGADMSNYSFGPTVQTTANIFKRSIMVAGTGVNRVYNGTTLVDVNLTSDGVLVGDQAMFTGTGNMNDKNVGQGKAVMVSGITASGVDGGNYEVNPTAATTVDISKRALNVGATGINRAYDGTTLVDLTYSPDNVEGDDLSVTGGTGAMLDKHAGEDKSVSVSGYTVNGLDVGNYEYPQTSQTTVDISRRQIVVNAVGVDKTYDGTTAIAVDLATTELVGGDQLTFSGVGTATDRNAGQGKSVAVSGITGVGADLINYAFNSTGQTTANVTPRPIAVTLKAPVVKFADGTLNAPLSQNNYSIVGLVAGDNLVITRNAGLFDDMEVGSGKRVSVQLTATDYVGTGSTLPGNYALITALITGDFGQILSASTPAYEAVIATIPTNPASTVPAASNFTIINGPRGPAVSTGESDNGVSTESSGPTADGGIVAIQSRENLIFRRTFSIADGGIRLPSGVADDDTAQ